MNLVSQRIPKNISTRVMNSFSTRKEGVLESGKNKGAAIEVDKKDQKVKYTVPLQYPSFFYNGVYIEKEFFKNTEETNQKNEHVFDEYEPDVVQPNFKAVVTLLLLSSLITGGLVFKKARENALKEFKEAGPEEKKKEIKNLISGLEEVARSVGRGSLEWAVTGFAIMYLLQPLTNFQNASSYASDKKSSVSGILKKTWEGGPYTGARTISNAAFFQFFVMLGVAELVNHFEKKEVLPDSKGHFGSLMGALSEGLITTWATIKNVVRHLGNQGVKITHHRGLSPWLLMWSRNVFSMEALSNTELINEKFTKPVAEKVGVEPSMQLKYFAASLVSASLSAPFHHVLIKTIENPDKGIGGVLKEAFVNTEKKQLVHILGARTMRTAFLILVLLEAKASLEKTVDWGLSASAEKKIN